MKWIVWPRYMVYAMLMKKKKKKWTDFEGQAIFQDIQNSTSSIPPLQRSFTSPQKNHRATDKGEYQRMGFTWVHLRGSLVCTEKGKWVDHSSPHIQIWTTEISWSKDPPWLRNNYLNQGQRTVWSSSCPFHLNFCGQCRTPLGVSLYSSGK